MRTVAATILVTAILATACGPKKEPARPRNNGNDNAGTQTSDHRPPPRRDEPQISGLMGTIDAEAVEKAFEAKMNDVRACRRNHLSGLGFVGGKVQYFFKIGMDGVPIKVVLEQSELGHHPLDACLTKIAKSLKFVKPKGGTAEVRYSFELAAERTEAKPWAASKIAKKMRAKKRAIKACRVGGKPAKFSVTFHILPQGKAKTAGVASPEDLPDGFAACVAKVVAGTTWPDPLGEVVRVTTDF